MKLKAVVKSTSTKNQDKVPYQVPWVINYFEKRATSANLKILADQVHKTPRSKRFFPSDGHFFFLFFVFTSQNIFLKTRLPSLVYVKYLAGHSKPSRLVGLYSIILDTTILRVQNLN